MYMTTLLLLVLFHEDRSRSPDSNDMHNSYCSKMALRIVWFKDDDIYDYVNNDPRICCTLELISYLPYHNLLNTF